MSDKWLVEHVRPVIKRRKKDGENTDMESSSSENSDINVASVLVNLTEMMNTLAANVNQISSKSKCVSAGSEAIPPFYPDDKNQDMSKWLGKIDELKFIHNWDDITTAHYATSKLRGCASTWYNSLPSLNFSWAEWKNKLLKAFPGECDYAVLFEGMMRRVKSDNETIFHYYYDKLSLLNLCEIYGRKAVSLIIAGIPDMNVKAAAKVGNYDEPDDLLKLLQTIGDGNFTKRGNLKLASNQSFASSSRITQGKEFYNRNSRNHELLGRPRKCYECGSRDHLSTTCPRKTQHSGKNAVRGVMEPYKHNSNSAKQVLMAEQEKEQGRKYFMNIKVDNYNTRAFVDMGANCNTLKEEVFKILGHESDGSSNMIKGFGGGKLKTLGVLRNISVEVDQARAQTDFIIVPNEAQVIPVIIGQPFTEQSHIKIYKDDRILRVYESFNEHLPQTVVDLPPVKIPIWVKEATVIPAQHSASIVCRAEIFGNVYIDPSIRMKEGCEHWVPRCVVNFDKNQECLLPIINSSGNDIIVKTKYPVARGLVCQEECNEAATILRIENGKDIIDATMFDIETTLTVEERNKVITLLTNYRKCFSINTEDIGCTTATELKIELTDDIPVTYRPYRMSAEQKKRVKAIVDELLEHDIVRESASPFASPVLLVKKKNGQERLCIDYRKLNQKIKHDRFPLPRMDDQLDQLQGYRYFTTLDMASGYYQISVEEQSKAKTAFVTADGHYEFNRMPFGISTAPAVFQRMINNVLGPLKGTVALVYLDDILIPSFDVNDGLIRLTKVLDVIIQSNLTLNPSKCHFLKTEISYLGFQVSAEGIRPGFEKTKSIHEFPTPKNVHQVRQFTGLTGFFRQFIQSYATKIKPLTKLTRKNAPWHWAEEQDKAFTQLKWELCQRPVLAIYNEAATTEVHTDASKLGLAGILLQKQIGDKLQPVAYYSRQTTEAEQKYHSYELECLAVVESLRKFRVYLLDIEFKVVTDCNSIKTTANKRDLIPRIARWWLTLQEFTFKAEHRPGSKMQHVDALSRNPANGEPVEDLEFAVLRIEKADWVLAGQLTDHQTKLIHEILQQKPVTEYERSIHKEYCLENGRIYKVNKGVKLWLVPKTMRNQVTRSCHDDFGHFSVEKMLAKLCETYWFPNMQKYVTNYIKSCIPCLFHKDRRGKQEGFLYPIKKVPMPHHTIHMDHLGPFKRSSSGKQYIIAAIDAFTKFTWLKAVKDTKTLPVIKFMDEIIQIFGTPNRVITDRGTCYTSHQFQNYCEQKGIRHSMTAVATPRANGQVERLNSTILSALATTTNDDKQWDKNLPQIQFAINNSLHSTTKNTPSELLFGYRPRAPSDAQLTIEIQEQRPTLKDLKDVRENAAEKITKDQLVQKKRYDNRRIPARQYKEGELVLVKRSAISDGQSKKLAPKYKGPFQVKRILPNDRYVIVELTGSLRSKRGAFQNIEAADRLKRYVSPENNDDTESEEGSDEEVVIHSSLIEDD